MYRRCIFCSADLGRNDALEEFPVGGRLAFDAAKGRLWAVCPRCRRWNLAPIEERWEAIESAERQFRDARLRAHSENVGLARLPDGTGLVRVGAALPGELAAWRYGDEMLRRRRWFVGVGGGAAAAIVGGTLLVAGGLPALAAAGVPAVALGYGLQTIGHLAVLRHQFRPVHRLPAAESPTGAEHVIRAQDAWMLRVVRAPSGEGVAIELPSPLPMRREEQGARVRWVASPPLVLEGRHGRRVLEQTLPSANRRTRRRELAGALERIEAAGGTDALLGEIADRRGGLSVLPRNANRMPDLRGGWQRFVGTFRGEQIGASGAPISPPALPRVERVALEMLVHEQSERRALEGELAELEAAWREAEEIAGIADALPDDPLDRLKRRTTRR